MGYFRIPKDIIDICHPFTQGPASDCIPTQGHTSNDDTHMHDNVLRLDYLVMVATTFD
jgi:hypothetical protein